MRRKFIIKYALISLALLLCFLLVGKTVYYTENKEEADEIIYLVSNRHEADKVIFICDEE